MGDAIKYKLQGVRCRKIECRESRAYYYRPKNHLAIDDKDQCGQSNYIPQSPKPEFGFQSRGYKNNQEHDGGLQAVKHEVSGSYYRGGRWLFQLFRGRLLGGIITFKIDER